MKIVISDNFNRDLLLEVVVCENIDWCLGNQMVEAWNEKYWNSNSDYYLKLVDDNYESYDGYKLMYGDD